MLFRIDTAAETPIFVQIAREVRRALLAGEVGVGDRLPAARELARSLEVNMHTVLRAYGDLRDEGLIELRRGRGAVVVSVPRAPDEVIAAVRELIALARRHDIPVQDLHHALDALNTDDLNTDAAHDDQGATP